MQKHMKIVKKFLLGAFCLLMISYSQIGCAGFKVTRNGNFRIFTSLREVDAGEIAKLPLKTKVFIRLSFFIQFEENIPDDFVSALKARDLTLVVVLDRKEPTAGEITVMFGLIQEYQAQGVNFRFVREGDTIYVPEDKVSLITTGLTDIPGVIDGDVVGIFSNQQNGKVEINIKRLNTLLHKARMANAKAIVETTSEKKNETAAAAAPEVEEHSQAGNPLEFFIPPQLCLDRCLATMVSSTLLSPEDDSEVVSDEAPAEDPVASATTPRRAARLLPFRR